MLWGSAGGAKFLQCYSPPINHLPIVNYGTFHAVTELTVIKMLNKTLQGEKMEKQTNKP